MKIIIIPLCLFVLLFQSCHSNRNNQNDVFNDREIIENEVLPSDIEFYTTKYNSTEIVCNDKNKLLVKTIYMNVPDTISPFGHLIFSQELIFYKNGIKAKSLIFPSKKETIKLQDRIVDIFQTSISGIKCHERNNGSFIYNIYGSHDIDPPHEFFGLISSDGEWLYYYYGSMHEVYESYGNEDELINEIGEEINSLKNMKRINL